MENNDFISSTNIDILTLWESIKEEIVKETSMFAFDVWIRTLDVIDIQENTIILATSTKSAKDMLNKNYKKIITNASNKVYKAITNVEIIFDK